jgi:pyridinium-3,5-biscarboxylic acid mononucleotide sulfurtransferase
MALGDGALAVTFDTPTTPRGDLAGAKETAAAVGVRHLVVEYDELADAEFASNPPDRCYHCKRMMASALRRLAGETGMACVADGTNAEDLGGHRPGYRALVEAGVVSPLAELGFFKGDVRRLARHYGLDWGKPSGACLASRIRHGSRITPEVLRRVDEAEEFLRALGFTQVRVRAEGEGCGEARIEVLPCEFGLAAERAEEIALRLGFVKVKLDLRGYRESRPEGFNPRA